MAEIKKENRRNTSKLFLIAAIFGLLFFNFSNRQIGASTCDQLTGDDKDKCEDLEKKAQAYRDLIEIKNKQQTTLQNQMALIDVEQAKNRVQLQQTQERADDLADKIGNLQQEIEFKENSIRYQQAILKNLIQAYYEDYQDGVLKIVLIDNDLSDIFNRADYVEQSSSRVNNIVSAIRQAKDELQREYVDVDQKKQESEQLKQELQTREGELQSSEIQKQALLSKTQSEKEKYQKLLDDIDNEISDLESQIAGSTDYSNLPPAKDGYFTWPVNPHNITQGYGMTSYAKAGAYGGKPHNGVDFGIKYSSIYAARAGKVIGSGDNGGYAYGKWIAIDHGDGLVTLYGHLSKKLVSKGDRVAEGEKIAVSGNTGNSTGPHLHFSVFVSSSFELKESKYVNNLYIPVGASVNPMKYL